MKRNIGILILFIFIIGIGVFEEIYIHSFVNTLSQKAENVYLSIENNGNNLDAQEVESDFQSLKTFWDKSKNVLCFLVNYEKIKSADESVSKIESAIKTNDLNLANENIAVIKDYGEILHYLMGFNINNLF